MSRTTPIPAFLDMPISRVLDIRYALGAVYRRMKEEESS